MQVYSPLTAGNDVTQLFIDRLPQPNHVRMASVKYAGNGWFLTVTPEDRIRAQVPDGENEILKEVHLPDGSIAFRFVNYQRISLEESSKSVEDNGGEEAVPTEPQRECYLGFSELTGRAQCYSDTSNQSVRIHVIPLSRFFI